MDAGDLEVERDDRQALDRALDDPSSPVAVLVVGKLHADNSSGAVS